MTLHAHPTIPSKITPEQAFKCNTGNPHALSSVDPTLTIQYWITTRSILLTFTQDLQEAGYDVLYFTPFSLEWGWTRLYPEQAISNTISVRLQETNLPTFPSLSSSMSTSLAPTTPPTHNLPSNQTVEPTTALIALMNQSIQLNTTMIAQLNSCPSSQPDQQPSPPHQFKAQRPPPSKMGQNTTNEPPVLCPNSDLHG